MTTEITTEIDWNKVEQVRVEIQNREGRWVGYNDPELNGLIPHSYDLRERVNGASSTHHGFAFAGVVFHDSGDLTV